MIKMVEGAIDFTCGNIPFKKTDDALPIDADKLLLEVHLTDGELAAKLTKMRNWFYPLNLARLRIEFQFISVF